MMVLLCGYSILSKDTMTCGQDELEIKLAVAICLLISSRYDKLYEPAASSGIIFSAQM